MVETQDLFALPDDHTNVQLCGNPDPVLRTRGFRAVLERERQAKVAVLQAVSYRRVAGDSWADIALDLGISRQAAQQRFGDPGWARWHR